MLEKLKKQYRWWWLRRLPDCETLTQVMSESMDHPISLKQRIILRIHNHFCYWCKWYYDQIRLLRHAFGGSPQEKQEDVFPKEGLSEEAKERIKRSLSSK